MENKQAYFNYEVLEEYIAGIVLTGSELKSIIDNRLSIKESFCVIQNGEIFLRNCHIDKHNVFKFADHEEKRDKKLLLHKKEINKLQKAIKEKGLTIMALSIFFNKTNLVKVKIGLCKGKKTFDKKNSLKEKDLKKETNKLLKR